MCIKNQIGLFPIMFALSHLWKCSNIPYKLCCMLVGKGWLRTFKAEGFKYAEMFVVMLIAMHREAMLPNKSHNLA